MFQSRYNSFKAAFKGVAILFKSEIHARIHLFAAGVVIGAGCYFSIAIWEWCLVVLAIVSVISAEAFNTSIEFLTDLVSPDYHPIAGKTKDVAAGAVLITAFGAAGIGLLIFGPRLWNLLGG